MQKVVKDNIIYVDKPKMSMVPLVLSAASLLFVALGAASLFYFQQPLQESQEFRNDASVGNGQVVLTSQLTSSPSFTSGTPSTIDLKYNSQGVQLYGIQIVTKVTANAETPTIEVPANSNLTAIFQEVEQLSDGYLVSMIITSKTVGQSISSTSPITFAKLSVPLRSAGDIRLTYDKANSFATVNNTNPPRDELRTPEDISFTIAGASSPSPSPTPSVSPTPSASPSPSPSATPAPSPTPNPLGDDFWLPGNKVSVKFFTNDTARTEVDLSDLVPSRTYRSRVQYQVQNAKKSSTNDQSAIQTAFVFNGQGSSYVTDDLAYSLIANHADGASDTIETVFVAQPDNTLRITTDSRNAYAESNESNNVLLLTFKADNGVGGTSANVCNKYCADSTECNSGFTCFFNQCRRADNPDSDTCVVPTSTIANSVAQSCNKNCSTNRDCSVNLRCYQGSCRLATNPSSFTCAAATAGVISKGTGTKLAGEKGQIMPVPTESPMPTVSPSTSPRPSLAPVSSPTITTRPTGEEAAESSDSFIANFMSSMQARGISLPVVAVGIGLILFVLALIFAILGRTNRRPPTVTQARKEAPKSVYEDELQKKINSLKSQSTHPVTVNTPVVSTPVVPSPVTVQTETRPTVNVPPTPSTPVSVSPSMPEPAIKVTAGDGTTATTEATSSSTSMMGRLRDRGVLENIAQADKPDTSMPPETPKSV